MEKNTDLDTWLAKIQGANGEAIRQFVADASIRKCIDHAPGSISGVYACDGGYVAQLIDAFGSTDGGSDALVVEFLRNIDRPFVYDFVAGDVVVNAEMSDEARRVFRSRIIKKCKIKLSPDMLAELQPHETS